ncbi:hypothetical protein BEL01nite_76870 [Bradyrhizobium elkanii]|nr:hypothetical protein BEL01nite_76870 [Bradyrhizobium elkanii]
MMSENSEGWTREQDELFWHLVMKRTPEKDIAAALNKTCEDLRRRGYMLGLPAKWFKSAKRTTASLPVGSVQEGKADGLPSLVAELPGAARAAGPIRFLRANDAMTAGAHVIVGHSAGPRLKGKRGVIVGVGATRTKVRVLLDGNRHPITFHVSFLEVEEAPGD